MRPAGGLANAYEEAMTMSKLPPETRGVVRECQRCGVQLHPSDIHEPHDPGCSRAGTDDNPRHRSWCRCSNTTCPRCCWQCHPPERVSDFLAADHRRCVAFDDPEAGRIWSLPADACGWEAHAETVDEVGWCPVCQHDHVEVTGA